jgi:hypothetical protein
VITPTKPQHTPGPHSLAIYTASRTFRMIKQHTAVMQGTGATGKLLAVFGPLDDPQSEADAILFVAAPDLFDACKAAVEVIADLDSEETERVFGQLLAAIRKVDPTFEIKEEADHA